MKRLLLASAILLAPLSASAQELTDERIKELALQAILENPQIIMEAVAILDQQRQQAQAAANAEVLTQQRALLEGDPNAPFMGAEEPTATIVEFFDYNCPYCKRAAADVKALLDGDDTVRVVYREWPILGEGSVFAARAALAAREQGLYEEMHWALMELEGRADPASVLAAARSVGLDTDQLQADMDAPEVVEHFRTSQALAQELSAVAEQQGYRLMKMRRTRVDGESLVDVELAGAEAPSVELVEALKKAAEEQTGKDVRMRVRTLLERESGGAEE